MLRKESDGFVHALRVQSLVAWIGRLIGIRDPLVLDDDVLEKDVPPEPLAHIA